MALAYALHHIESNNMVEMTNYGEYLERYPSTFEVEIDVNTSWSCAHGLERWRADCGCNTGKHPDWNQTWRAPLRDAMNWLRDNLARIYEGHMSSYVHAPWQARGDYIEVILDRSARNVDTFLSRHLMRELSKDERVRILKLLEMQRHALLMFTSCGWFFDDISSVETLLVMKHASRAMQLAKEACEEDLEPHYLEILEGAPSNVPHLENGARVWEVLVRPATADLLRVGAHYAMSSLFEEYPETIRIGCYTTASELYEVVEAGTQRLALGKAHVSSDITGDERAMGFAVIHLGDHNVIGGIREYIADASFALMRRDVRDAFNKGDVAEVVRLMDKHFETHNYSLWHLFRDEQRKVLNKILESTLGEIEASFHQIYERHYSAMQVMREMGIPLPKAFATATELILSTNIRYELQREELDLEEIQKLIEEAKHWSL